MPSRTEQDELLKRCNALSGFSAAGLSTTAGDRYEVVIERRGHVRGVWHCVDGKFAWTPAGYGAPSFVADNVDAAVEYIRKTLIAR